MKLLPASLQAFLVVARSGTVHAAARELSLTQTAITRRVLGLEEELGVTLFLRSRRGMSLTEPGQDLLVYCQHALDLEGETLARMTGATGHAPVKLTVQGHSSILRSRLISAISAALAPFPQVAMEFRMNDVQTGVEALKRGDADLVVLRSADVVDEFASKRLKPERYVLVGPSTWAGRALKDIVAHQSIIDFDPGDQMTFALLDLLGLRQHARDQRHFVNNTDALATMVEAGIGYSVLAEELAGGAIAAGRLIQLDRKVLPFDVALAWHPRRYLPAYFRAVLSAVK